MSIATIEKITIQESIIMIYPTLYKNAITQKIRLKVFSLPKQVEFGVLLLHQFESTRSFGKYPLESDSSENMSIAKLNVEVNATVAKRVKKLIVKQYQ